MAPRVIAFDTETALIDRGLLAPPLACVTVSETGNDGTIYHWTEAEPVLKALFESDCILVGQNTAYDTAVICRQFPALQPLVWRAYADSRITCTMLRQRLLDIESGTLGGTYVRRDKPAKDGSLWRFKRTSYSLSALHARYGFGALEKDEWRLTYGELRGKPLETWPQGAIHYATLDAAATYRVWEAQERLGRSTLGDQWAQARRQFALHLIAARGLITDGDACDDLIDACEVELDRARARCRAAGLIRESGSKNVKVAQARMLEAMHVTPEQVVPEARDRFDVLHLDSCDLQLTKSGKVAVTAQACRDSFDDVLIAYAMVTSADTLRTKVLTLKEGSRGLPLTTRFKAPLATGRTSSSKPGAPHLGGNFQNFRRDAMKSSEGEDLPGMRECIIPRPGFVLCSIDLDNAEMRAFAQVAHWTVGYSRLGDVLNEDRDVHLALAATILGISYEDAQARKKDPDVVKARQFAKIPNFALLGGARAAAMMRFARGMGVKLDIDRAYELEIAFHESWTEAAQVHALVKSGQGPDGITVTQFISNRVRGGCTYTQACNSPFQGLVGDATSAASFALARECEDPTYTNSPLFGSGVILFPHDEWVIELPEHTAHEAAYRARDVILEACAPFFPDVPMTCEPALMTRFSKGAVAKFSENGRLIP